MAPSFEDNVKNTFCENITLVMTAQAAAKFSEENGECVPQREYQKGTGPSPSLNVQQDPVLFYLRDGSFLPIPMALLKEPPKLVCEDGPALPHVGQTVTVRFEWPGYPSQDYQLRTIDWRDPPNKIPIPKLAKELAKLVKKFIKDTHDKPIEPEYARWKVGPGNIQIEHLRLASFEQASKGSWQLRLFYKRQE